MNITSTATMVHAIKDGYQARSLCGGMRHTASKYLTDAPVDCPECLAILAESAESESEDTDWQRPYRAANGHTMVQVSPNSTWNAQCTDDCDACHGTGPSDGAAENRAVDWHEGITFHLPTGSALPLAFWIAPVDLDHAAECEPLGD